MRLVTLDALRQLLDRELAAPTPESSCEVSDHGIEIGPECLSCRPPATAKRREHLHIGLGDEVFRVVARREAPRHPPGRGVVSSPQLAKRVEVTGPCELDERAIRDGGVPSSRTGLLQDRHAPLPSSGSDTVGPKDYPRLGVERQG